MTGVEGGMMEGGGRSSEMVEIGEMKGMGARFLF